jgi:hypothetical protein
MQLRFAASCSSSLPIFTFVHLLPLRVFVADFGHVYWCNIQSLLIQKRIGRDQNTLSHKSLTIAVMFSLLFIPATQSPIKLSFSLHPHHTPMRHRPPRGTPEVGIGPLMPLPSRTHRLGRPPSYSGWWVLLAPFLSLSLSLSSPLLSWMHLRFTTSCSSSLPIFASTHLLLLRVLFWSHSILDFD